MKLSIIIPVYNVERYVVKCLDSLLTQGLERDDYEIIVIDDGSTDDSISLVSKYQTSYQNILIFSQKNQGVGAARNKGLDLARGEYVYFIDPDDYLADRVLGKLLNYTTEHKPDILAFKSKSTTDYGLNSSRDDLSSSFQTHKENGLDFIAHNGFKNEVWWYLIRKSFLDAIELRFIQGRWMEDAIFTAKLFVKAKSVARVPIDAHRHVKVPGSAMTNKEPNHYLKVIRDNANAAVVYHSIIKHVIKRNEACAKRLKSRQQSFVFFLLIRTLKSTMKRSEIFPMLNQMKTVGAYPLNSFIGQDYNGFTYVLLSKLFSNRYVYFIIFLITNPFLKLQTSKSLK